MRLHALFSRLEQRGFAYAVLLLLLPATGCASFVRGTTRGYDITSNGLTRADDGFRRALSAGNYASAFARSSAPKAGAPDDAVLRALYRGLTGYYAGEFVEAASAFATADRLAERRLTRSVSRAAASVVTSDAVLPYLPTRTERLFVRYYAMGAHARAGNLSGAVVEARRLARLLEEAAESLAPGERPLHASMRDAAGAVFEAAGERNDALVSYRNAALLRGALRRDVDSIVLAELPPHSASLIVFVESGFVAHRVDQGMTISLHEGARARASDSTRRTAHDSAAITTASDSMSAASDPPSIDRESLIRRARVALESLPSGGAFVGGDSALSANPRVERGRWVNRPMRVGDASDSFVRVAWSALARSAMPAGSMTLGIRGDSGVAFERIVAGGADVSNALAEDFRRDLPGMLARSVARAVAKGAATEALREKHGDWAGTLASLVGSAVERADTRSWSLLPGSIGMIRLTLPAGTHEATIKVGGGLEALTVRLPAISLTAGEVRVISTRIWRDASGFAPAVVAAGDTTSNVLRTNK